MVTSGLRRPVGQCLPYHLAYIDLGPHSIHFCDLPQEATGRGSLLLVCIAEPGNMVASEGSFILAL